MMKMTRPWLTHGIAFETDPNPAGGGAPTGTGTGGPAGGGGQKTLADILKEHPHISAEVDARTQRIAATEKTQGKTAGVAELAKTLGLDSPDEIAAIVKAHRDAQSAAMTEAEKAKADAAKTKAEADAALRDAKQARLDAIAIKHLSKAGAEAPEVLAAGLARFGVTLDSGEEDVAKAVEEMKKVMPGSFGPHPTGTPAGAGHPGTPPAGTPQGASTGADQMGSLAKAQLERRTNRRGSAPIPGM